MRRSILAGLAVAGFGAASWGVGLARAREHVRPPQGTERGPDSSQVRTFLGSLGVTDPVLCQDVADSFGNFWSSGEDGTTIGEFADRGASATANRELLRHPVRDPGAIRMLMRELENPNACVRRVAAKMLGRSIEASRGSLAPAVSAASARVREAALYALGTAADSSSLAIIERATADREPAVAAMAAWAIGSLEAAHLGPLLVRLLRHGDSRVEQAAAWSIGQVHDSAGLRPLIDKLRSAESASRLTAARALGQLELPAAARPLAALLDDPIPEVRRAAASAIGELDELRQAPPELIKALASDDVELKRAVANALASIHDPAALSALGAAIRDPDLEVRRAAVRALAETEHPDAERGLLEALKDRDPEIRKIAAEALGQRR